MRVFLVITIFSLTLSPVMSGVVADSMAEVPFDCEAETVEQPEETRNIEFLIGETLFFFSPFQLVGEFHALLSKLKSMRIDPERRPHRRPKLS